MCSRVSVVQLHFLIVILLGLPAKAQEVSPKEILATLLRARGGEIKDAPDVQITARRGKVASYSPHLNRILIENDAIRICNQMEDKREDALAFLIAHELTHFFQHQIWRREDAGNVSYFTTAEQLEANLQNEKEADLYGAFILYLAGYDYYNVAPILIEKLYVAYEIDPTETHGYPPMAARRNLTRQVCDQVRSYCRLFESANGFHLLGKYRSSHMIYSHLLQFLQMPEIYYNAGINQLLSAISKNPPAIFPIHLVQKLNLRSEFPSDPQSMLAASLNNFKKAVQLDPQHHAAYIGILINCLCQSDLQLYEQVRRELLKIDPSSQIAQKIKVLDALRSNLDPQIDDREKCKAALTELMLESQDGETKEVCRANLAFLEGNVPSPKFVEREPLIRHQSLAEDAILLHSTTNVETWCDLDFSGSNDRVTVSTNSLTSSLVFIDDLKNSQWLSKIPSHIVKDFGASENDYQILTHPAIILLKSSEGVIRAILYR